MTTTPTSWQAAEAIADVPAVHEALDNFSQDATGDNGTGIVQAVIEALAKLAPAWIRTDERLPETDEDSTAYVRAVTTGCPGLPQAPRALEFRYHSSLGWQPLGAMGWDWIVTHWMPHPALPQEYQQPPEPTVNATAYPESPSPASWGTIESVAIPGAGIIPMEGVERRRDLKHAPLPRDAEFALEHAAIALDKAGDKEAHTHVTDVLREHLPPADGIETGLAVIRKDGQMMRSGASAYVCGIVACINPFILISEEADMLWSATVKREDFVPIGTADEATMKRVNARLASHLQGKFFEDPPR